jgi:hypothetical protein
MSQKLSGYHFMIKHLLTSLISYSASLPAALCLSVFALSWFLFLFRPYQGIEHRVSHTLAMQALYHFKHISSSFGIHFGIRSYIFAHLV